MSETQTLMIVCSIMEYWSALHSNPVWESNKWNEEKGSHL